MKNEIYVVCLYIAAFGFSDLLIKLLKVRSMSGLLLYYVIILGISIYLFRLYSNESTNKSKQIKPVHKNP
jgi:uncharacterized protein with PQ loop repeat